VFLYTVLTFVLVSSEWNVESCMVWWCNCRSLDSAEFCDPAKWSPLSRWPIPWYWSSFCSPRPETSLHYETMAKGPVHQLCACLFPRFHWHSLCLPLNGWPGCANLGLQPWLTCPQIEHLCQSMSPVKLPPLNIRNKTCHLSVNLLTCIIYCYAAVVYIRCTIFLFCCS